MKIKNKLKEFILSKIVDDNDQKIGLELETFYYNENLDRIQVNTVEDFSALQFLDEIRKRNTESSYSLEPGGQLEWASKPCKDLWSIELEFKKHQEIEDEILNQNSINKLQVSVDPLHDASSIDLIKAPKYEIMANHLKKKGKLSNWMMRNTTSVQVNIDYTSEDDANQMAYIADNIQPIYSIVFSNSPFINGQLARERNFRWEIWENTDPNRCGSLFNHGIKNMNTFIDDYIDWLLGQPSMYTVNQEGHYSEFHGTILESIDESDDIFNQIDIILHQSFTNVRFKPFLEIRSPDRPLKNNEISPGAFISGILTSPTAREKMLKMILEWSDSDKFKLIESAFSLSYSNPGPKGKMIGYYIEKISDIALEGLDERSKLYKIKNEKSILEDFLNNVISFGPKTIQLQNEFKKSGMSVESFIKEMLIY